MAKHGGNGAASTRMGYLSHQAREGRPPRRRGRCASLVRKHLHATHSNRVVSGQGIVNYAGTPSILADALLIQAGLWDFLDVLATAPIAGATVSHKPMVTIMAVT